MNLTVDIGNSSIKAALFDEDRLVEVIASEAKYSSTEARESPQSGGAEKADGGNYELRITNYDRAIVVSTRGVVPEIEEEVRRRAGFFVKFDHTTPVPLKNLYATPQTLGYDRLAAAVGAHSLYPDRTMLVVDFGTAITCDIVTAAGEYLGGSISPGAASRFRALHDYTEALPLCELRADEKLSGFPARDTRSAIEQGVIQGIVAETEYRISVAEEKFPGAGVIFTGGDAEYFAERVKFPIFAVSELVFKGLNAILEYNANL